MGHNTKNILKKLPQTKNGDIIKIITTYGEFQYKIYNSKIIGESDFDELPIQQDEEILMLYTCYPVDGLGHATHRYVVYAQQIN